MPIIPVGVLGTEAVQPIGSHIPARQDMTIRFGKPMDFTGRPADSFSMRAITDEVMAAIQASLGQEYVGRYAPLSRRN